MTRNKRWADVGKPGFLSTELANSITHGVGCLLSVAALVVLVVLAAQNTTTRHVVACSIYGSTLIALYLASTLYHSLSFTRAKPVFRAIDHSSIYLLIAGTYTPFTLIPLNGGLGWTVFGIVWGLAAAGVAFKVLFTGRFKIVSMSIYLLMGWMSILILRPLVGGMSVMGVWWLAAGGVAYTAGVIFYAWKSLRFHHAIWHLFVMTGSLCHFFSVMYLVLPQ